MLWCGMHIICLLTVVLITCSNIAVVLLLQLLTISYLQVSRSSIIVLQHLSICEATSYISYAIICVIFCAQSNSFRHESVAPFEDSLLLS